MHGNQTTAEHQEREAAREYVRQRRVFHFHAAAAAASILVILGVNAAVNLATGLAGEWWAWWSGWAVIGWSIALAIHGLLVRLARPEGSGSAWEERQVDELLSPGDA